MEEVKVVEKQKPQTATTEKQALPGETVANVQHTAETATELKEEEKPVNADEIMKPYDKLNELFDRMRGKSSAGTARSAPLPVARETSESSDSEVHFESSDNASFIDDESEDDLEYAHDLLDNAMNEKYKASLARDLEKKQRILAELRAIEENEKLDATETTVRKLVLQFVGNLFQKSTELAAAYLDYEEKKFSSNSPLFAADQTLNASKISDDIGRLNSTERLEPDVTSEAQKSNSFGAAYGDGDDEDPWAGFGQGEEGSSPSLSTETSTAESRVEASVDDKPKRVVDIEAKEVTFKSRLIEDEIHRENDVKGVSKDKLQLLPRSGQTVVRAPPRAPNITPRSVTSLGSSKGDSTKTVLSPSTVRKQMTTIKTKPKELKEFDMFAASAAKKKSELVRTEVRGNTEYLSITVFFFAATLCNMCFQLGDDPVQKWPIYLQKLQIVLHYATKRHDQEWRWTAL